MSQLFALTEEKEAWTNEKSELSMQLKTQQVENDKISSQLIDGML